jgi:hypothetical protein
MCSFGDKRHAALRAQMCFLHGSAMCWWRSWRGPLFPAGPATKVILSSFLSLVKRTADQARECAYAMAMETRRMIGLRCAQGQILWSVISRIVVNVMDDFDVGQGPSYLLLHDVAIAIHRIAINRDGGSFVDQWPMSFDVGNRASHARSASALTLSWHSLILGRNDTKMPWQK